MLRYVVRRLLLLVPILVGVSLLIFFWIRALPGSPAEALLGERATPALVQSYREKYGLNKPLWQQYVTYVKTTAIDRDLGVSVASHRGVVGDPAEVPRHDRAGPGGDDLRSRLRHSARFLRREAPRARLRPVNPGRLVARNLDPHLLPGDHPQVPVRREVAPLTQRRSDRRHAQREAPDGLLRPRRDHHWRLGHALGRAEAPLVLPAIALGSIPLAVVTRITRAAVLDVQNEDYVRTARAKGLPPFTVDRRHILRNALLPVSTIIGLQTGLCCRAPC